MSKLVDIFYFLSDITRGANKKNPLIFWVQIFKCVLRFILCFCYISIIFKFKHGTFFFAIFSYLFFFFKNQHPYPFNTAIKWTQFSSLRPNHLLGVTYRMHFLPQSESTRYEHQTVK